MRNILILISIFLCSLNVFAVDRKIQADIINPTLSGNAVNIPKVQVDNINLDANTAKSTSGDLVLDAASAIRPNTDVVPNTTGVDLGSSANRFQNVYSTGEHFGLRIENVTSGTIPASSSTTKGKLVYTTDTKKLYVDDGTNYIEAGGSGGGISEWLSAVSYPVGSIVHINNKIYKTIVAHTAGTFATDLAAAKWVELSTEAILSKGQSAGSAVSTKEIQAPFNQITDLGSGVSLIETGNLNVLKDPSSEAILTSWAVYKNSVVASSPDVAMAGSTAANNLQVSNSATSPLEGTRSLLLVKQNSVNAQGEGIKIPFTIPAGLKYKMIRLSFLYQIASGTYTDDQIEFFIKDVTNGTIKPLTPSKLKNHTMPSDWFNPNGEYQTSDSTSYELIAHIAGTSAQNYSLRFDLFKLGIQERTYGSVVTDWKAYTPTVSGLGTGTVSASAGFWRQVGDTAEIMFNWTKDGSSGSGASVIYTSLPPGLSVNVSKFPAGGNIVGDEAYSSINKSLVPVVDGTGLGIYFIDAIGGSAIAGSQATASSNFRATIKIPILGWGTTHQLSSDGDGRNVYAFASGSNASVVTTVNQVNLTVVEDSHGSISSNAFTVKVPGVYDIDATIQVYQASGTTNDRAAYIYLNGSQYLSQVTTGPWATTIPLKMTKFLKAGDVLTFYGQSGSIAGSVQSAYVTIKRQSGNQQLVATESVSMKYTNSAGTNFTSTASVVPFATKVWDSHNAWTGSQYNCPVNGEYSVTVGLILNAATYSTSQIPLNANLFVSGASQGNLFRTQGAGSSFNYQGKNTRKVKCLQGQNINVTLATDIANSILNDSSFNYIEIHRIGNY